MESFRRLVGAVVYSCLLAAALPAAAADAGPQRLAALAAQTRGQVIDAPGAGARAELVTFGADLAPALLRVPAGESVRIAGWPVSPGERADVTVTRFEIYAPGAKVWKVEGDRTTEVPRSGMAFFRGQAVDDSEVRIFLAVEPAAATLEGLSISQDGSYEIRPHAQAGRGGHLVTVPEYFLPENLDPAGASSLEWSCGQEGDIPEFLREATPPLPTGSEVVRDLFDEAKLATLHTATIAVDTDNELMLLKFSDNTTSATNYVASLIAAMNVIYERDLNIRLLQGNTFLRVSTTADPYSQTTSGGANSAQLQEFSTYWDTNLPAIPRALAMMLSGKGTSLYSSSGIAWLTSLCSKSYGYSFTQVFKFPGSTGATDAFVVGHELGHNFGSPHTHCYNPPIDTCYVQATTGCYSGPTSCPAATTMNGVPNVTGTLMSYCHLRADCDAFNVFHPTTVDLITGVIQPRIGLCISPATLPAPSITLVSPASGYTTGGTSVTISGANFQNGATVSFGGTPATSVTFVNASQLTAVTPARAAGLVNVVVTNPDTQTATSLNGFTYLTPPPVLVSVNLPFGPTAGGTTVTLTGSSFQNGATVTFDGIAATSVNFVSSTQMTAVSPAHATGTVEVRVINPDTQAGRKIQGFFYAPPPSETDFFTVEPCRILDTRSPDGPLGGPTLGASGERTFQVTGNCGIPADAVAVVANVTTFAPGANGNVSIFPGNAFYLGTSTMNYTAGMTRANNAVLTLATNGSGTVTIRNGSAGLTDVILDVSGYFSE